MDRFKNFLKGKKVDKHFKKQGHGAKLGDGNDSSSERPSVTAGTAQKGAGTVDRVAVADVAAQAAYKRMLAKEEPAMNHSQKKIQMIARQELENEKRQRESKEQMDQLVLQFNTIDEKEFNHSNVIKGVFYTCELLGDEVSLGKQELHKVIEDFLREQLRSAEDDAVIPAVMILYTLNKKDARQTAVETICAYLKNIAEFPDEPKYRRIRLANKALQDRVLSTIGGLEILAAVGFEEVTEGEERYLSIPEHLATDTGRVISALEMIREGQPVPIKVSRDTKAFKVTDGARVAQPQLPPDFFDITPAELAKEQQLLKDQAERMTSLRTRDMRERDATLRNYKYKYTLIRVRFADRFVVQGTFSVYEPVRAVREWIADLVAHPATQFELKCANEVLNNDTETLGDAKLAPCAVIHLEWNEPIDGPSLKESLLSVVQPLE